MRKNLRFIVMIVLAMAYAHAVAEEEQHDSVYFYSSWEEIIYDEPSELFLDPYYYVSNPYELEIWMDDEVLDEKITNDFIAALVSDSIMVINSDYLKENFSGDARKLSGYVPLFFNEKVAFTIGIGTFSDNQDYYYIDFRTREVSKVTSSFLSGLLEEYHDLQMRYEGMKNYKKREIIEDYFDKFIQRATDDPLFPYILDLME